jgi:hypothetical protein
VEDDEVLISFLFAHLASILLDPRPWNFELKV